MLAGAGFMTFAAALLLSAPELLARVFTDDVPVLKLAALLIPIAGIFQVFDGLQVVAAGVLRGVGDTRVPMLLNLVGFWLVGLPVSYGLGFVVEVGPAGIWSGPGWVATSAASSSTTTRSRWTSIPARPRSCPTHRRSRPSRCPRSADAPAYPATSTPGLPRMIRTDRLPAR